MTSLPSTFDEIIIRGAKKYADRSALICKDRPVTYSQLHKMALQLARAMIEKGVKPGDRIAIVLPNGWHFVVAIFAGILAGTIVVPLDFAIRPGNFKDVLQECSVTAVILDHAVVLRLGSIVDQWTSNKLTVVSNLSPTHLNMLNQYAISFENIFLNERTGTDIDFSAKNPQAVVSISYTSGSTGAPKGVMHSHESWISSATFTGEYLRISIGKKILLPLPLYHAYSFRHILTYLIYGGTSILCDNLLSGLTCMKEQKPDALLLVPAACNIILKQFQELIQDCSQFIDFVSIGTAPISTQQLRAFEKLLPHTKIHLPYGLTEARVGFLRIPDDNSLRQIFEIAPELQVKIMNNGKPAKKGQFGEITLKGQGLMVGYWNSSETENRQFHKEGFGTGDRGRMESDGAISLFGRIDNIIEIGGRKVLPIEVETVLNQHPLVRESAVLGIKSQNGMLNRELKALVILEKDDQLSEKELLDYCKNYLEPYKIPTTIEFKPPLRRCKYG